MDSPEKPQNLLSLFTGYGGMELGLGMAGVQFIPVAHVENEAFSLANLVSKMEKGEMVPAPIWPDIKSFDAKPFCDKVDIITGGYPCQPFSSAGKRKGKSDERNLWPYVRDIIKDCNPKTVFLENVEGHLKRGLKDILADLEQLDFCPTWGIFSAAEVGAPHLRKRIFILAHSCSRRLYAPMLQERFTDDHWLEEAKQLTQLRYLWPRRPIDERGEWEVSTTIKSLLGRAANGASSRLDQLRLIGNGVVPQVAAKAWIVLSNRFNIYQ